MTKSENPKINPSDKKIWKAYSLRSIFACAIFAAFVAVLLKAYKSKEDWIIFNIKPVDSDVLKRKCEFSPTYAIYGQANDDAHLVHVHQVLGSLGYCQVGLNEEWNLLWAHDYPFLNFPESLKNINLNQKVNHWPGCGFITNKVDLSTSNLPYMPRAFKLPNNREEFLKYANNNHAALFVEKHNEHRHIKIRKPNEINVNSNNSFVQEFIQNPLLVDGYKFDIGVYVVITSINPLRAYIYTGDVLFRYCTIKYYPFNADDINKYVVGDDYLPTWEVPSLKNYFGTYSGSMKASFDAYLRDHSADPTLIWSQVEQMIVTTLTAKENDIKNILRSYKVHNFFDLIRFDLIIDANLKVWLMEANMSPNLSSAHFKQNSLLYEQILYSVFNLIGVGSPIAKKELLDRSTQIDQMIVAEKNLAVKLNFCATNYCDTMCNLEECNLCMPCLTGKEYDILKESYLEHLHRIDMKRIFPKPILNPNQFDIEKEVKNMSERNKWLSQWFWEKCRDEQFWCI